MSGTGCSADSPEVCHAGRRRALVRASRTLAGIDYVEIQPDGLTLCVHFFGHPPGDIDADQVVVEGGRRIRGLRVVAARSHGHANGDACLLVTLDRTGDVSRYCVCLVDADGRAPAGIDPRYACGDFSFHTDCPSALDCKAPPCPPAAKGPLPPIDYLARDYEGFRRLLLDRLAQTMPQWRERHAPDIGVTLVEVLAYVADQLSYELDAVATEAFLRTARRRISVRRHARLVDYRMHEGCNARAWVSIEAAADSPAPVPLAQLTFAAIVDNANPRGGLVDRMELARTPGAVIFEPVAIGGDTMDIVAAHSEIRFYTWQDAECCLPAGSTRATLLDGPAIEHAGDASASRLRLAPGLYLVLEATRGCVTGAAADADPGQRHVVCLTRAVFTTDPATTPPTPLWEIEWDADDALPFDLHLSLRTPAPECAHVEAAVARGNVLLVDHGATVDGEDAGTVRSESDDACCLCDGASPVTQRTAAAFSAELAQAPVTHAERPEGRSASEMMRRDPRRAAPAVRLRSVGAHDAAVQDWTAAGDLLASGPDDRHFVVEVDDEGRAHLRFGDDVNGEQPDAGLRFTARYRVGNGPAGNVGHDTIVWLASTSEVVAGLQLAPRNPLSAMGGSAAESIDDVKLYAPRAYGRVLERAVAAEDYAQLAGEDARVQGASAELAWTGSGYEATVALDTYARHAPDEVARDLLPRLDRARRIGHDVRIVPVRRVPLDIALQVCVAPHALRGEVERRIRELLSSRELPDGSRGMFHPDELRFGADVSASRLVALVQAVAGVVHVELSTFARSNAPPSDALRSLQDNRIAIRHDEVAVMQGDPTLALKGGR